MEQIYQQDKLCDFSQILLASPTYCGCTKIPIYPHFQKRWQCCTYCGDHNSPFLATGALVGAAITGHEGSDFRSRSPTVPLPSSNSDDDIVATSPTSSGPAELTSSGDFRSTSDTVLVVISSLMEMIVPVSPELSTTWPGSTLIVGSWFGVVVVG